MITQNQKPILFFVPLKNFLRSIGTGPFHFFKEKGKKQPKIPSADLDLLTPVRVFFQNAPHPTPFFLMALPTNHSKSNSTYCFDGLFSSALRSYFAIFLKFCRHFASILYLTY